MKHDVFISYGREDTPTMQRLERALRESGFTSWTDHGIAPGTPSWKTEIEEAIRDARCIVVLFSPESAESRWVRAELDFADAHHKPIYPLLVRGDSSNAVPFGFTSYQWIDVRKSSQWVAGLLQLTAALRSESPVLPTETVPPVHSNVRRPLLLAVALLVVGIVAGVLLINNRPQTAASVTPTNVTNVALTQPTALPTIPPFTIPVGYKKLEGNRTLVAVPSNWSTDLDPQIFSDSMKSMVGENKAARDYFQNIMQGLDTLALDFLRFQGVVISIEDIGMPIPYALLEQREEKLIRDTDPTGIITSHKLVDMPTGTMLFLEETPENMPTVAIVYSLVRGPSIYNLYLTGRYADRGTLESIAEKIAQTFRVKE